MKKTKVSIIVPVYGVEKYLRKCLDTLVNQTLKDFEIIVVNDGSPDNSQLIIDEYSKKYSNIHAYIKENGGLSDARNYGLKYASGEYIAFVDSDDYVSKDMFEKMYNKAISGNFDLVICDLNLVYENSTDITLVSSNVNNDTTNIKKLMKNIYPVAWNKLYKRTLFNNKVYFKERVWFEDVEFLYRMLPFVKTIGVVKEPFYQYLQRQGSITSVIDKRLYNYIDNWNGIIKFYKERNLYNDYHKELEYSYVRYLYATFLKRAAQYNQEDYFNAVDAAIKNVKEYFPHYRRNAYFYQSIKGLYLVLFNRYIAKILYRKEHKSN